MELSEDSHANRQKKIVMSALKTGKPETSFEIPRERSTTVGIHAISQKTKSFRFEISAACFVSIPSVFPG
ncbi:hypothetical protein BN1012_Phect1423 [Candidatus Phaeomarinobacter ectocarpi]|uniref:Uncharacterized protein n=1 Tax=Candidatus Phaeomarinibacter ectocarpi TaxID=1458461 RepID=X5MCX4_9HYPH|nr:hypothetical protein BN1012_Phect1423 [Candidatus Phaeomarinobacter ectocarpi]